MTRRPVIPIISRATPVNSRLIPTSVPMAHTELDGQWTQINTPTTIAAMPLTSSHPEARSI